MRTLKKIEIHPQDHTTEDTPLDGTNPFNDDPPDSVESFADSFNISVVDYVEEVELYEEVLEEVMEINEIAGRVVDLVSIQFHRLQFKPSFC